MAHSKLLKALIIISLALPFTLFHHNDVLLADKNESADGKYTHLLQTLPCPQDKKRYGNSADFGWWGGGQWCGKAGRAGYWVYRYPNWYVWKTIIAGKSQADGVKNQELSANPPIAPEAKELRGQRGLYGDDLGNSKYAKDLMVNFILEDVISEEGKDLDDSYFYDIFQKHGVRVVTQLNSISRTATGCCNKFTPVKRAGYPQIKKYTMKALDKYPPGFVQNHLKKIIIVREICSLGSTLRGFAPSSGGEIIFVSTALDRDIPSISRVIHHEFNHVLFARRNFVHAASGWETANTKGVKYGRGGMAAIAEGRADSRNLDKWLSKGFASEYGTASLEEDFATMADYALGNWKEFRGKIREYPSIARKLALLMQFYTSFDSRLDYHFWTGEDGSGLTNDPGDPAGEAFFLDDPRIARGREPMKYLLSSLLHQKPAFSYHSELKKRSRKEIYSGTFPMIINDTALIYKIRLMSPEKNADGYSIMVVPGSRFTFPVYDRPSISNYWALQAYSVPLQPLEDHIRKADPGILPRGIFFVKDVLDIGKRPRRSNAPLREIYLSTLLERKGKTDYSIDAMQKLASTNHKNPFGYVVINDTEYMLMVKTYSFSRNGEPARSFRILPGQNEASGIYNSLGGIEIKE